MGDARAPVARAPSAAGNEPLFTREREVLALVAKATSKADAPVR
jgi:hypothetical protein